MATDLKHLFLTFIACAAVVSSMAEPAYAVREPQKKSATKKRRGAVAKETSADVKKRQEATQRRFGSQSSR